MTKIPKEIINQILNDCDLQTILNFSRINKICFKLSQVHIFINNTINYNKNIKYYKINLTRKIGNNYDMYDKNYIFLNNSHNYKPFNNQLGEKIYFNNLIDIFILKIPSFIDDDLITLKNLTHLDIRYNNIISDNSVKNLYNLTHLSCNNKLTDNSIKNLTQLVYLDRSLNGLITEKVINNLTNLKTLKMSENMTCKYLTNLQNLKTLYACENITDSGLLNFPDLEELYFCIDNTKINNYFYNNYKFKISDISIKKLTKLKKLKLNKSNISDEGINLLTNLIDFDFQQNDLITNNGIKNLINMINITCNGNITDEGLINMLTLKNIKGNIQGISPEMIASIYLL